MMRRIQGFSRKYLISSAHRSAQAGSAILRVSDVFNDGCVKWKARYGADAKAWITAPGHPELRLRGVLCSVAQGGEMRVGDRLKRIG